MSSLKNILDEWGSNPNRKDDLSTIMKWRSNQQGSKASFLNNLWDDCELSKQCAEELAVVLLEISKVENKKLSSSDDCQKIIRKEFDSWSAKWLLSGNKNVINHNGDFFHITTDFRLRRSGDYHGDPDKFPRDIFQKRSILRKKIQELNQYSNPNEKRAIWTNWISKERECSAITVVFEKLDNKKGKTGIDRETISSYRAGILNMLNLKEQDYRGYIIILRYRIPDDLDVRVPTVADARWGNYAFRPKSSCAKCGSTRAPVNCNEGVHGHVDLKNLTGLVVLRPTYQERAEEFSLENWKKIIVSRLKDEDTIFPRPEERINEELKDIFTIVIPKLKDPSQAKDALLQLYESSIKKENNYHFKQPASLIVLVRYIIIKTSNDEFSSRARKITIKLLNKLQKKDQEMLTEIDRVLIKEAKYLIDETPVKEINNAAESFYSGFNEVVK